MMPEDRSLRVLVVSRWYPSHDDTSRGRFVADQVAALTSAGVEVVVASFEPVYVRGPLAARATRVAEATALWRPLLGDAGALRAPVSWGAGVPVARLPVVLDAGERANLEEIEAHEAALEPFVSSLAARWAFDIVHAHTGVPDGVAALRVADRIGRPLVVTEHASTVDDQLREPETRAAYLDLASHATVVAVSRSLARRLAGALGISETHIGVLANPVDVEAFSPAERERDENELLYVGNRKASKGIETLLRAFAEVRAERPTLRLRLIGRAPEEADEARWADLAAELGVDESVSFEPPRSRLEVAAAMRHAAIFVHPSPRETFGVVAAEALATGLPVVAAPSEGVVEILGPGGECGEVATGADARSLASAIRSALDRRTAFRPETLRRRALAFSPGSIAGQSIALYGAAIEGAAGEQADAAGPSHSGDRDAADERARPAENDQRVPVLVVGLSRPDVARRVQAFPAGLASSLTIVTTHPGSGGPAALPETLPPARRWIEIDPDASYLGRLARLPAPLPPAASPIRRAVAFLRHPRAVRARRRLFEMRQALRDEGVETGLREALATVTRTSATAAAAPRAVVIVAADADDALAVRPLLAHGVRLAPGSLRWLADGLDGAEKRSSSGERGAARE